MRLEDEIQQKGFTNETHKLFVNLRYTANWMKSREHKIFKNHGLSAQQFNVLRILKGQHPNAINLNDISSRMLDKDSNTSRLTDKLCRAGLTHRAQDSIDRRQVRISITQEGMEVVEAVNRDLDTLFARIQEPGQEAMRQMNDYLDQLRNNRL